MSKSFKLPDLGEGIHEGEVLAVNAYLSQKYGIGSLVANADFSGVNVTLNNDTRAELDWLEILVKTADMHNDAGMVACRICSFDDPDMIDSIGMGICRDGMSRGRFRNRRWSSLEMNDVEKILFPSACAALYRKSMLDEIGFFDVNLTSKRNHTTTC